jgi:phage replication-related protein YjqB (UPF0714/DUF867 family)
MYHGFGESVFDEYHVSTNDLAFTRFDELPRLQGRRFRFGVSFHIHEAGYVGVGGRINEEIRTEVADRLNDRLPSSKEIRYHYSEMKNRGRKEPNIVNRITESGSDGLQIEMTRKTSYNYWKRVAQSVRDVYVELL